MSSKSPKLFTEAARRQLRTRAESEAHVLDLNISNMSGLDICRMVNELKVHEIELSMQNEELRQTQVDLAESRDRLAELYDFAPIGYVTLDENGKVLEANLTAAKLLGVDRRRLLGQSFTRLIDPQSQDTFYLLQQQTLASDRKQSCDLLLSRSNATRFPAALESICVNDVAAGARRWRVGFTDNTARVEAEKAVRLREQHYRALMENAAELTTVLDAHGLVVYQSPNVAAMLGYTAEELTGRSAFSLVHPEDLVLAEATLQMVLHRPEVQQDLDVRMHHKDGSWRYLHVVGKNRLDDPAVGGIVLNARDITERKEFEMMLRKVNADLEGRVAQRTSELKAANEKLSGEVAAHRRLREEMVAISQAEQKRLGQELHDGLCGHLVALRFANDRLHRKLGKDAPRIASQTTSIARMLDETLEQARNLSMILNPVEVEAEGLMAALAGLAAKAKAFYKLSFRFVCLRPVLVSDPQVANHLFRIAQEAVRNAATHGAASRITIGLKEINGFVKLSVANNGRPLPEKLPTDRGMGLRNMRYRAEVIGASLDIRSRPRGGALVVCLWPKNGRNATNGNGNGTLHQ